MLIETPRVAAIFYVASAKWLRSHPEVLVIYK